MPDGGQHPLGGRDVAQIGVKVAPGAVRELAVDAGQVCCIKLRPAAADDLARGVERRDDRIPVVGQRAVKIKENRFEHTRCESLTPSPSSWQLSTVKV